LQHGCFWLSALSDFIFIYCNEVKRIPTLFPGKTFTIMIKWKLNSPFMGYSLSDMTQLIIWCTSTANNMKRNFKTVMNFPTQEQSSPRHNVHGRSLLIILTSSHDRATVQEF
jgi:hypothetical protein